MTTLIEKKVNDMTRRTDFRKSLKGLSEYTKYLSVALWALLCL